MSSVLRRFLHGANARASNPAAPVQVVTTTFRTRHVPGVSVEAAAEELIGCETGSTALLGAADRSADHDCPT